MQLRSNEHFNWTERSGADLKSSDQQEKKMLNQTIFSIKFKNPLHNAVMQVHKSFKSYKHAYAYFLDMPREMVSG